MKITIYLPYLFIIFIFGQNANAAENYLEENKKIVVEFFKEIIIDRTSKDIDKYIGDNYVEHSPYATGGGKEQLRELINNWPARTKNEPRGKIVKVIADKDFVVLHILESPNFFAVAEFFRMENSKIVEHWDVVQALQQNPEK